MRRGSIHALIGPNGAGKTTCFNLLTKFLEPTRGQILFDGHDITRDKPADIARRGVVRSFQISSTFPNMSVLQNVRVALQQTLGTAYQFWKSESTLNQLNMRCMELLDEVGLTEYSHLPAVELPYGRKRALEIATTLAMEPKLMLLDEPTQGMSHSDTHDTEALIRGLSRDHGLSILLVEHDVELVMNLSDHVVVMHQGQKLAEGSPAEVRSNAAVQAAYFGEKT